MKEWILIKDLLGVAGLPSTPQGVLLKAKKENWKRRRVAGVKGNIFEYHIDDMPQYVRQALGVKRSPNPPADYILETPTGGQLAIDVKAKGMNREELEQALRVIEQALGITTKEPAEQKDAIKLNNHERRLLHYYQKSSIEGKEAIMNVAETMATLAGEKEKPKPSEAYKVA